MPSPRQEMESKGKEVRTIYLGVLAVVKMISNLRHPEKGVLDVEMPAPVVSQLEGAFRQREEGASHFTVSGEETVQGSGVQELL